jgi:hypothetical protein
MEASAVSDDGVELLDNGPDPEPGKRLVRRPLSRVLGVVPVLSFLVVALAVALVISLLDRPGTPVASGSDNYRIACAELGAIKGVPSVKNLTAYNVMLSRIGVASTATQLAAALDPKYKARATSIEQVAQELSTTFRVDPASVATAVKTCKKH